MLGLIGKNLRDHEYGINHVFVTPKTEKRVNLQPWAIEYTIPATKEIPARKIVIEPASQEEFQEIIDYFNSLGSTKNMNVGVLPDHVAKEKQKMYDKAVAELNKKAAPANA